jgi:hypothetical protein
MTRPLLYFSDDISILIGESQDRLLAIVKESVNNLVRVMVYCKLSVVFIA